MGWLFFFIIVVITSFILVPLKRWKHLWPSGLIAMVFLYAIDSTLIWLGAFSYTYANQILSGLPILYWPSSFFGGVLLAYYYPARRKQQFPYILLAAFVFLIFELIMARLEYFHYGRWNPIKSYFLDILGFLGVLWIAQWLGAVNKE